MRSALLCVFFALIVYRGGRATTDEDFKPTLIPLNDWHGHKRDDASTSQEEATTTKAMPTVAPIPARYWEDALRHSVYLTLVRDKIDQLIAKGNVISPDSKLERHASKEIDDHNLWEKIKTAPFDRLNNEEPAILGNITTMSKGRLLEENDGYRFTDDETSKVKCDEKCMEGVKALWSVKRVRQKDAETIPGKYHYELTFSVNSQPPKKNKKPYDNSVRTFTVREGTPVEQPQYTQPPGTNTHRPQKAVWFHKNIVPAQSYQSRKNYQAQGLDRFFLSLFSDDDDEPPRPKPNPYAPPPGWHGPQHSKVGYVGAHTEHHQQKKLTPYPHKPTNYKYSRPPLGPPPTVLQAEYHYLDNDKLKIPFAPPQLQFQYPIPDFNTKIQEPPSTVQPQYIDSIKTTATPLLFPEVKPHTDDKEPIPFSMEVQQYLDEVKTKYSFTPPPVQYHYDVKSKVKPPTQVQHLQKYHYKEPDVKTKIPFSPHTDHRYQPSNVIKTTRPAVAATPSTAPLNLTMEVTNVENASEITTKEPEIMTVSAFKPYQKHKPPPTKVSYFPEHVRPPVFNAPPGVFVTMDKKPFKPMPPLKFHTNHHPHSKPIKPRPPIDFRPSPQVVDVQLFSDPDPLADAFRPMAINYGDNTTDSSESTEKAGSSKQKHVHNKNPHKSKPPKKHELITQSQRATTSTPDIITAQSQSIEADSMHWANNLLGAFVKTTPMVSQEARNTSVTTTPFVQTTTVTEPTTTITVATTTEVKKEEKTTTTTPKTTKRTRPPPKFTKPEKIKKHKRVSTTTIATTSTFTTTTEKPRSKRPTPDLSPQASSAATGTTKSGWQPKSKTQNDTTTTPIAKVSTDATTTSTTPRAVITSRPITTTTRPTTKMTTTTTPAPPVTEPPVVTTQSKTQNRFRLSTLMHKGTSVNHDKWSNPITEGNKTNSNAKYRRKGSNFQGYVSSTPKNIDEDNHKEHVDVAYAISSTTETTEMLLDVLPVTPEPQSPEKQVSNEESDYPNGTEETEIETDPDESTEKEDEEAKDHTEFIFNDQTESSDTSNEVIESQEIKESSVVTTTHSPVKNKTKCKKKKLMNLTTTEDPSISNESIELLEIITTTEQATTEADIFTQIFGGYSVAGLHDNKTELLGEGSENKERLAHIDDDLEDFLESLEKKPESETNFEQYDDEDNEDNDYSENTDEDSSRPRHADVSYEEYRDRPYSFLELMAME